MGGNTECDSNVVLPRADVGWRCNPVESVLRIVSRTRTSDRYG